MAKTETPLVLSNKDRQANWRIPLLNATSKVLAIAGTIWLIVVTSGKPAAALTPRGFMAIVLVFLIWIAALFKRLPEAIRLGSILTGFMGVAAINIVSSGPAVPGVVLPLILVLLMAILYRGLRGALETAAAILILFAAGAYGWVNGIFPLSSTIAPNDPHDVSMWFRNGIGVLFVFSAIVSIVGYLMKHGQHTLEELRASEERAHVLIEHAPEAIVVLSVEQQRFTEANPAAERLFGYSRADLLLKSPMDVSPDYQPDGRLTTEAAISFIQKALQGGEVCFNWMHRDAQGREFPCEIRLLRLPGDSSISLRGTVIDISQRSREEQLREHSLSLMNATLESTADGILVVNVEGKIETFNRVFTRMWNLPDDVMNSGDDTRALQWVSDQLVDPQQFVDKVTHLYHHPHEESFDTLIFKDGRVFERFSRPQIIANNVVGRVWSFRDVTEQRRAAEANAILKAQLLESQKMEAIGTLAGGIAHDFNNILTSILGYAMFAKQVAGNSAELNEYLEQVVKGGKRAAELVNQILSFSRRSHHKTEPVQLRDVVDEAIKLLRATIPASITIEAQLHCNVPKVLANATQLHQVMMNLASNAYHAMRDRLGTLSIRLDTRELDGSQIHFFPGLSAGKYVCLIVTDTGCGMDKTTLDRIFEPFFTTKAQGEGTGLGLSVVHGIVRGYHGAVYVTSEIGKGTQFQIFLPAMTDDTVILDRPSNSVQRGRGEHILFVDDEEALVSLGKRMLESLGYSVHGETKVLEALSHLARDPSYFDLVITDQSMPNMMGLDFAMRVRELRADLPVLLVTGYSAAITADRVNASGIREVLPKPYSENDLAAAVQRHIRKQNKQQ